jgi:hypothetical protein
MTRRHDNFRPAVLQRAPLWLGAAAPAFSLCWSFLAALFVHEHACRGCPLEAWAFITSFTVGLAGFVLFLGVE